MYSFWNTRTGKFVVGGCGVQLGAALSCGVLAVTLVFCAACVFINGLSLGLRQGMAALPPATTVPVEASSPEGIELLLQEVDLLLDTVDSLQTNPPAAPPQPVPAPPSTTPIATARHFGANLYSGPGMDYNQVAVLPPGESWEIAGRNIDASWWLVVMPDGRYVWVRDVDVTTANITDSIPAVTTPAELTQLASTGSLAPTPTPLPTPTPTATATPTPFFPPGTPTPDSEAEREYVENLDSYKKVNDFLLVLPGGASFSPDGSQVAMTDRIKLYTFMADGAYTDIWLEDDEKMGPLGNIVWSPDGEYVAFVVGFKDPKCRPCRMVALLRPADGSITYLEGPDNLETDAPRWTQDGRIMINVHPGEPADGVAYLYDVYGRAEEASGVYLLSSSHEGQKWYPWLPGRIWRAGVTERADSYNSD
jgi:hypothetical protein